MADHITNLVEIYNRWLDNNDIKDRGSADEVLFAYEPLTEGQRDWLKRFIDIWEEAQEHDVCLPHLIEQRKEEKERAKQDALHDIRKDEDYAN